MSDEAQSCNDNCVQSCTKSWVPRSAFHIEATPPTPKIDLSLVWANATVDRSHAADRDPICFTPGTKIITAFGPKPVETLAAGDMILTRDNGFQPLRWIWARTAPGIGRFAPVRVAKHTFAGQSRDLILSAKHRILLQSPQANPNDTGVETLGWAGDLVNGTTITQFETGFVTYIHLLLDQHEIVLANDVWVESLHPDMDALAAISEDARCEVLDLFPALRCQNAIGATARAIIPTATANKLARLLT